MGGATHQTANLCSKLNCASLPRPQGWGASTSEMIQEDMKILEPQKSTEDHGEKNT